MNKFTAREMLKGRSLGYKKRFNKKSHRSERQQVRCQIKEIEKISGLDHLDAADISVERWISPKDTRTNCHLRKFLHSRIGQPWDDVYAEICASIDRRSHAGYEAFKRLEWAVADEPEGIWKGWGRYTTNEETFYVDDEGKLQFKERPRSRVSRRFDKKQRKTVDDFVGAKRATGPRYIGDYYWQSYVDYPRKVIQHGSHLYWAYSQGCGTFIQREELTQNEVEFFNSLDESTQKSIMYIKEKRN